MIPKETIKTKDNTSGINSMVAKFRNLKNLKESPEKRK